MRSDIKVNLLLLSDFHYRKFQDQIKVHLQAYIDSFIDYCKETKIHFDYLILAGDISNEGNKEEYDLFFTEILDRLFGLENFNKTRLLVVPGNHDVVRNIEHKKLIVNALQKDINQKREILISQNNILNNTFAVFTESFRKYKERIPKNSSSQYLKHFYHGFFIDHESKLIFVLLNSAWFSTGREFLEDILDKLLDYFTNDTSNSGDNYNRFQEEFRYLLNLNDNSESHKIKREFIKNVSILSKEFENQVVCFENLGHIKKLLHKIENYSDYICLTIMHHDLGSLNWEERFGSLNKGVNNFALLKSHTDILITGHTHVPNETVPDQLGKNGMLNLPVGSFIFPSDRNSVDFNKSWFSRIEINVKKRLLYQHKINYHTERGFKEKELEIYTLSNKYEIPLTEQRRKIILKVFRSEKFRINFLNRYFRSSTIKVNEGYINEAPGNCQFLIIEDYQAVFDNIKKEGLNYFIPNVESVYFIFVDLFFDRSRYSNKSNKFNRLLVLNDIKNEIEFVFDNFRGEFFSGLTTQNDINRSNSIAFICTIIPFWELETCLFANK